MKCFIVYWENHSIHHYFATYEKAEEYLVNNNLGKGARIAKLLAVADSETKIKKWKCEVDELPQPTGENSEKVNTS